LLKSDVNGAKVIKQAKKILNGNKTFVIFVNSSPIWFDVNTIKLTLGEIFARMSQKIVK